MSWQARKLGEFISIKHGWAFKGELFSDSGRYVLLTPGNAHETGGLKLRPGKEKFYLGDFPPDYLMKTGDMLVVMTDLIQAAPILGGAIVVPEDDRFLHNQRLGLVDFLPNTEMDKDFLYHLLNSPDYRAQVRGSATGATVRHTAPKRICDCTVLVPDTKEEQRQVAQVLSAYDDLIATNQRRIALLEDAARRLYREWFVHLRFPDHESVPVKDGVPEGWLSLPLTDCADFINGFAFKPEHQQEVGLPIVKIPELRDGVSSKTPKNSGVSVPSRNHIDVGDVLFSWSATLLVNEWSEGPALLNQHIFKVVPKHPAHKRLIRFAVEAAIPLLLGQSVGATMQHIRRSALDGHLMLVPDRTVADAFAALVDPMMDMVLNLQGQNKHLRATRDSLLPKLMSGQLDVSGIRLLEEATA
jgi:type I restriction enzyme, S subunit